MPVIRPKAGGDRTILDREKLIDRLVRELLEETSELEQGGRPVIYEMPAGKPGLVNVIVVWEAWRGMSPNSRSKTIIDAYERYGRILENSIHLVDPSKPTDLALPRSSTAIGATWNDVLELDLLPFSVRPTAILTEPERYSASRLMRESGAIETPEGLQLRFPNRRLAEEAAEALTLQWPLAGWTVFDSVGATGVFSNQEIEA